jgi:hypothetical protein
MVLKRSTGQVFRPGYGWVQFIPAILEMINPKSAPAAYVAPVQSSNTGLYVVGGLLSVALVGGLLYVAVKA